MLETLLNVGNRIFELDDATTRPSQHLMVIVICLIMIRAMHSQRIFEYRYLLINLIYVIIIIDI